MTVVSAILSLPARHPTFPWRMSVLPNVFVLPSVSTDAARKVVIVSFISHLATSAMAQHEDDSVGSIYVLV